MSDTKKQEDAHKTLYDAGMVNRRAVLGDAYVDNALARGVSEFARPAQEYVTENAWGNIWERPGLERKQRSLVVISLLAAGGHTKELAGHVRGGLNNGLTEVEIREVLLQIMAYCGFPTGLEAFRAAEPAIEAWKAEQQK
ncbi:CMD-domain-containing protein [Stereum hirsutum FP-91666 SS1]|uniref:CMD-domain-containing protein n=1 Tax=Stereum hirsutum (strain FP-91666) TaxID=721885 RepID=UPI00044497F6|nr:CMD-domain-containing protein [Stereum hirsutum FP-91666 SS1]EIM85370.1 CMD-domain-containing protein [Stereum hirsutum FP-91666 SS1]